jgi:hypothetical protein
MKQRTVLISPWNQGSLDALRGVFLDLASVRGESPVNFDALFASAIFQAGIDRFLTFGDISEENTPARFITDRTSTIKPDNVRELYGRIRTVFESQLLHPPDLDSRVLRLSSFIVDLGVAARYRTSLLTTRPLEDISNFRDSLRPELFAALERFFATLEHNAAAVPLPTTAVRTNDVDRLRQILDSDLFTHYSTAHGDLEQSHIEMRQQIRRVEDTARNLTRGFSDYLSIRNLVLSGLTITGQAVELFLGALPASLLAPFKKFLEAYVSADHRVIIYDLYDAWHPHFESQIQRLTEHNRQSKL